MTSQNFSTISQFLSNKKSNGTFVLMSVEAIVMLEAKGKGVVEKGMREEAAAEDTRED